VRQLSIADITFNWSRQTWPALAYGAVTQESAYRVEVTPDRKRVFCMSVSSLDGRDRGRPSSWSAAVDSLVSGIEDGLHVSRLKTAHRHRTARLASLQREQAPGPC
jgi:hypothetical protein